MQSAETIVVVLGRRVSPILAVRCAARKPSWPEQAREADAGVSFILKTTVLENDRHVMAAAGQERQRAHQYWQYVFPEQCAPVPYPYTTSAARAAPAWSERSMSALFFTCLYDR